jgi:hypothetical protein
MRKSEIALCSPMHHAIMIIQGGECIFHPSSIAKAWHRTLMFYLV